VDWTNQPCGTLDRGVRYLSICSAVLQSCPILLCIYTYISLINNNPTFSAYHTFSQDSKSGHRATESRSHCLLEQSKSDLLRRQHLKRVPVYFVSRRKRKPHHPARGNSQSSHSTLLYQTFNQDFTTLIHHQISPCVITLKSSFDAVTFAIQSGHGVPIMRRHINAVHRRWLRLNLGELSTYPLGHI